VGWKAEMPALRHNKKYEEHRSNILAATKGTLFEQPLLASLKMHDTNGLRLHQAD